MSKKHNLGKARSYRVKEMFRDEKCIISMIFVPKNCSLFLIYELTFFNNHIFVTHTLLPLIINAICIPW